MENEYSSLITSVSGSVYGKTGRFLDRGEDKKANISSTLPKNYTPSTYTVTSEGYVIFKLSPELKAMYPQSDAKIGNKEVSATSLEYPIQCVQGDTTNVEINWGDRFTECFSVYVPKPEEGGNTKTNGVVKIKWNTVDGIIPVAFVGMNYIQGTFVGWNTVSEYIEEKEEYYNVLYLYLRDTKSGKIYEYKYSGGDNFDFGSLIPSGDIIPYKEEKFIETGETYYPGDIVTEGYDDCRVVVSEFTFDGTYINYLENTRLITYDDINKVFDPNLSSEFYNIVENGGDLHDVLNSTCNIGFRILNEFSKVEVGGKTITENPSKLPLILEDGIGIVYIPAAKEEKEAEEKKESIEKLKKYLVEVEVVYTLKDSNIYPFNFPPTSELAIYSNIELSNIKYIYPWSFGFGDNFNNYSNNNYSATVRFNDNPPTFLVMKLSPVDPSNPYNLDNYENYFGKSESSNNSINIMTWEGGTPQLAEPTITQGDPNQTGQNEIISQETLIQLGLLPANTTTFELPFDNYQIYNDQWDLYVITYYNDLYVTYYSESKTLVSAICDKEVVEEVVIGSPNCISSVYCLGTKSPKDLNVNDFISTQKNSVRREKGKDKDNIESERTPLKYGLFDLKDYLAIKEGKLVLTTIPSSELYIVMKQKGVLGENVFSGTGLYYIYIPNDVTKIESHAFEFSYDTDVYLNWSPKESYSTKLTDKTNKEKETRILSERGVIVDYNFKNNKEDDEGESSVYIYLDAANSKLQRIEDNAISGYITEYNTITLPDTLQYIGHSALCGLDLGNIGKYGVFSLPTVPPTIFLDSLLAFIGGENPEPIPPELYKNCPLFILDYYDESYLAYTNDLVWGLFTIKPYFVNYYDGGKNYKSGVLSATKGVSDSSSKKGGNDEEEPDYELWISDTNVPKDTDGQVTENWDNYWETFVIPEPEPEPGINEYDPTRTYEAGDRVYYQGTEYYAIQDVPVNENNQVTDSWSTYWSIMR